MQVAVNFLHNFLDSTLLYVIDNIGEWTLPAAVTMQCRAAASIGTK